MKFNAITMLRRGRRVVHAAIVGEGRSLCGRTSSWMIADPKTEFAPKQVTCVRCRKLVDRELALARAIEAYSAETDLSREGKTALVGEPHKRHLCVLGSRDAATAATAANAINTLLTNAKTLGLSSHDLTCLRHALGRIEQGTPDKTLLSAMFIKAGVAFETRVDSRFDDRDLSVVDVNVDDQSHDPLGTPQGYVGHVATFVFNHDGSLRSVLAWS